LTVSVSPSDWIGGAVDDCTEEGLNKPAILVGRKVELQRGRLEDDACAEAAAVPRLESNRGRRQAFLEVEGNLFIYAKIDASQPLSRVRWSVKQRTINNVVYQKAEKEENAWIMR
jgi:hypothetical protein